MEWPLQSPDINVIEHLRTNEERYPPPSTLKELEKVLIKEWLKIPVEKLRKLCGSILRRIAAVCKAKGDPTP